jgi:secondary thiamine-phosphate synthase enzyme
MKKLHTGTLSSKTLNFVTGKTVWFQKEIIITKTRGCHIITKEVVDSLNPELNKIKIGILHLFIQHTSASITINESYDPDVMKDLTSSMDRIVPEDNSLYKHLDEGEDDAPSHIKSSLIGSNLSIPITDGQLSLGTWQGIIMCEFRNEKKTRKIIATINGCIVEE